MIHNAVLGSEAGVPGKVTGCSRKDCIKKGFAASSASRYDQLKMLLFITQIKLMIVSDASL